MGKTYYYYISRGKNGKGNSVGSRKKQIYEGFCEECKQEWRIGRLELDHKIPVALAGHVFNLENLQLLCCMCHRNKTYVDKAIINMLKKLKLLDGSHQAYTSFVPIEKLHQLYHLFEKLILSNKKEFKDGIWGEDEREYYRSNLE